MCVHVCARVHVCVSYGCLVSVEGAGTFFGIEIKPSEGKMLVLR